MSVTKQHTKFDKRNSHNGQTLQIELYRGV